MQAQGSKGQIIFQRENVYKQDPSPADARKLHFVSESLKLSQALEVSNIIRGNRNPSMPARGNAEVSGSITTHLQVFQLGSFFRALLGAVETTGTNPYVHVIKIGDALPSLMIEKGFTDVGQYVKYNGCKINRASFSVTASGFQEITFDIMGARETVSTASFDTTPIDGGYVPFDGFAIATVEEGGSSIANVVSIDGLTIENNLDGSVYVIGGQGERLFLPEGTVRVSGTLKALFQDMTLYNKAKNNIETSLKIVYRFGNGSGTAGNEYLEFFIPELKYSPNTPVIAGPQGILVEMPFEAYYRAHMAGSAIVVTIKNTEPSL